MDTLARGRNGVINTAAAPGALEAGRIAASANGTVIALDPDIPPNRQRVSFTAEGPAARWTIDGKAFAQGSPAKWLPWPGRHVVQLVDARGAVLDEVKLEVRGAGVRASASSHAAR